MSRLRKNKFDVQVVWPGGGCMRWTSRTDVTLTPEDVARKVREFADRVTSTSARLKRKGAAK